MNNAIIFQYCFFETHLAFSNLDSIKWVLNRSLVTIESMYSKTLILFSTRAWIKNLYIKINYQLCHSVHQHPFTLRRGAFFGGAQICTQYGNCSNGAQGHSAVPEKNKHKNSTASCFAVSNQKHVTRKTSGLILTFFFYALIFNVCDFSQLWAKKASLLSLTCSLFNSFWFKLILIMLMSKRNI